MRRQTAIRSAAFLLATWCASTPAFAQTPVPASTPAPQSPARPSAQLERDFLKNLLRDQKAIWTSPAHIRSDDLWCVGSLAGATAALIATDRRTGDAVAEHPELVGPSLAVSHAGSGYTIAAAIGSFYLVGRATRNERAIETGLLGAEAFLNSAIVIVAVKGITQRARPDSGDQRGEFFVGGASFPSGHAGNIWSFATVVASEYHDRRLVPIVAYSIAGLVTASRFTGQRHYLSDVLVGSAVGFAVGRYVYRVHHLDHTGSGTATGLPGRRGGTGKWPLISPQFDGRAKGYRVGVTWIY